MPRHEKLYFQISDFPDAINVTMENGWVVVWLKTMRIKFRNWQSEK